MDQSGLGPRSLHDAIVEALAYSDVFDYPLRVDELHRYLSLHVTRSELIATISRGLNEIESCDGYYFLRGRAPIVAQRLQREVISRPAFHRAIRYGRLLANLPFIRMVALTGSLALLNADESGDLDYMLITAPGRVWMARGFALLLGKLVLHGGYTLCPNLILSQRCLSWSDRDLYTAREICQMIPISGEAAYTEFRGVNTWTADFLPNAYSAPPVSPRGAHDNHISRSLFEWPLRGVLGQRIETWEMTRKIRRFSKQPGYGIETRFDADVCQGNFGHHGAETRRALHERLAALQAAALPAAIPLEAD